MYGYGLCCALRRECRWGSSGTERPSPAAVSASLDMAGRGDKLTGNWNFTESRASAMKELRGCPAGLCLAKVLVAHLSSVELISDDVLRGDPF